MFLSLFNQLANVDSQTQQLLNNLMEVLLLILYAIGGCGLAFSIIKYAFKIHSDLENKVIKSNNKITIMLRLAISAISLSIFWWTIAWHAI